MIDFAKSGCFITTRSNPFSFASLIEKRFLDIPSRAATELWKFLLSSVFIAEKSVPVKDSPRFKYDGNVKSIGKCS